MLPLVGLGMPLMWAIKHRAGVAVPRLAFWLAAVIGAAVTPTDPVAATPIVAGDLAEDHVPERLRHPISQESGLGRPVGAEGSHRHLGHTYG